jgi:hypothetical protein
MPLRERVFARFHQVATGTLRVSTETADEFASHIAAAHDAIHVFGQLCFGANALQSNTLGVMLERWFRLVPEYEMPARLLANKPGPSATVTPIRESTAMMLHSRVFEICVSQCRLPESQALQVAEHFRQSASAFVALEQKCMAPEKHAQRVLCGTLRAALGLPLQHLHEAASVYLEHEA